MHNPRPVSVGEKLQKLLLIALAAALALMGNHARADDPDTTAEALAAAKDWLQEIDAGHYVESYQQGCVAFHNKVSQDQWVTILRALRPALGTVISRKETGYSYHPDGVEGCPGECMVVTYKTSFSKVAEDLEVIVMKREDGQWRGAGYNAQPQSIDVAPGAPQSVESQTDTQMQTTPATPQPSQPAPNQ